MSTITLFASLGGAAIATKTAAGWVCDISKCGDYQWDDYGVVDKYPPIVELITR